MSLCSYILEVGGGVQSSGGLVEKKVSLMEV